MARPSKNEIAPGVFPRGKVYWLRYTPPDGGEQVRMSLGTKDPVEAVRLAKELRGKTLPGRSKQPRWDRALSRYLKEGLKSKKFRKNTADVIGYASKAFTRWSGVTSPDEVTSKLLQDFYDLHSGYSEVKPTGARKEADTDSKKIAKAPKFINVATAQGYCSKLATFLRSQGLTIKIDFRELKPESRDIVVAPDVIEKLIRECPRADLKFVQYAGFHAGLRKEEIIMSRPQWFRLDLGHVAVPKIQEVDGRFWEVKSSRPRKVPLTPEFKQFLENEFGDWQKQTYMLHPEAKGKRYRWDFKAPFNHHMKLHGLWKPGGKQNVTPHTMRHTYITRLADQGYSAAQIAAWSGDRIKTIETNYLHTAAPDGAVDNLYSKRKALSLEEIAEAIKNVKDQIGEQTTSAMEQLIEQALARKATAPAVEDQLEWSAEAPKNHVRLYSVEDTLSQFEAFQLLFDHGDEPSNTITYEDWDEGKLSTKRARLGVLKSHGWIKSEDSR